MFDLKTFSKQSKKPKAHGFLGFSLLFYVSMCAHTTCSKYFKKALSLTARPADWWAMLNQIDFEQNIVHSCYGSIQWWLLLISKLLNFRLHLGSRKATCTSGRQSKLKTSSATMVKRMLQVQWFWCTSKNAALEKNFRESTFDWFWFDDWFNRCSSTEYWGLFQCTFVGKFNNILKSCNVKNGWMDLMGRGGWIAAKC